MAELTVVQGTDEWKAMRGGIPTASRFHEVLANGRGGGESKTRRTYMMQLAGEILTGEYMQGWGGNVHTERGKEFEPQAKTLYSVQTGIEVEEAGFFRKGRAGASPDGKIPNGGLEIKSKLPHLHLETLLANRLPPEHKAQVQGEIWVCEFEFVDFVSYWPGLPLFIHREYRDDEYIKNLEEAVTRFNNELDELLETIRKLN